MSLSRVRRWFAAGITGALFTVVSLVSAGSVGAVDPGQPYVVPVGYNNPQSNVVVVAPPGTVNAGVAYNPFTNSGPAATNQMINGQPYNIYGGYAVPVNVGVPYLYYTGGQWMPYNGTFPGYGGFSGYGYGYGAPVGCPYGCTAAGPVVGADGNGSIVVYDVRGGTDDLYQVNPATGKYVEVDSNGNPIVAVSRP
jgi:hypothetical protein